MQWILAQNVISKSARVDSVRAIPALAALVNGHQTLERTARRFANIRCLWSGARPPNKRSLLPQALAPLRRRRLDTRCLATRSQSRIRRRLRVDNYRTHSNATPADYSAPQFQCGVGRLRGAGARRHAVFACRWVPAVGRRAERKSCVRVRQVERTRSETLLRVHVAPRPEFPIGQHLHFLWRQLNCLNSSRMQLFRASQWLLPLLLLRQHRTIPCISHRPEAIELLLLQLAWAGELKVFENRNSRQRGQRGQRQFTRHKHRERTRVCAQLSCVRRAAGPSCECSSGCRRLSTGPLLLLLLLLWLLLLLLLLLLLPLLLLLLLRGPLALLLWPRICAPLALARAHPSRRPPPARLASRSAPGRLRLPRIAREHRNCLRHVTALIVYLIKRVERIVANSGTRLKRNRRLVL